MKSGLKFNIFGSISFSLIISCTILSIHFPPVSATVIVRIQTWNLVDATAHLDYYDTSSYGTQVTSAKNVWNAYKSGVIRTGCSTNRDCYIFNGYEVSNVCATTYPSGAGGIGPDGCGYITLNSYVMDASSNTKRQSIITHELGHALGIGHTTLDEVMCSQCMNIIVLQAGDMASYDAAYAKYSLF